MENEHNAPTTANAGHTTGGRMGISEEVTAIPQEKRNVSRRKGSSRTARRFGNRPPREHGQKSDHRGQSVKFIL